jgi:iron complex outermembrane receptor protein
MTQSIISIVLLVTLAWTGGIKGRVVDARTGKPLAGAVVLIVDGEQGSKTNEFGYFNIRTVLPGDYDLICSYRDYRNATIKGIVIRMDSIPQLFFALRRTTDVVESGFFAFPSPLIIDSTSSANSRSARSDTLH